ncbi:hypothetical protein UFOVP733_21 [uncultured Caudovirales phage]|uniref:Uncharacterized protein n=1 Tax=uncultured Caudovirales phage TaxID=2100421 RepID=A0A6J5NV10_9CAUD|nr:hypothetical protein UFOVP733_21 [uncultured Caudovirales phage]CAB5224925.1 hypothetical protein UFOVP743_38 [uncultured Caudovirales phage]
MGKYEDLRQELKEYMSDNFFRSDSYFMENQKSEVNELKDKVKILADEIKDLKFHLEIKKCALCHTTISNDKFIVRLPAFKISLKDFSAVVPVEYEDKSVCCECHENFNRY